MQHAVDLVVGYGRSRLPDLPGKIVVRRVDRGLSSGPAIDILAQGRRRFPRSVEDPVLQCVCETTVIGSGFRHGEFSSMALG
jgi:hypothetical protein